jgi:hypothetical protein
VDNITKVLLGIVSLAVVATVLVNGTQAAAVVKAGGSAFSGSLTAAEKG